MTIRVNEVIIIKNVGIRATNVRVIRILNAPDRLPFSSLYVIERPFETFRSLKSSGVSAVPGSSITVGCVVEAI